MTHRANLSLKRSAAALLALTLAATPALALPRSQGTRQPTAAQSAAEALKQAEAQLKLAQDYRGKARLRVEAAMKSTRPDWLAATKEHDKAAADVKAAERAVDAKLKTRADYKAAANAWTAADTKYKALEQDPKGNQDQLEALHQERTKQVLVMRELAKQATDNDPKLIDAKARLAEAKAKVDAFKSEVDLVAMSDPEYLAAQQQVTAAEQQVMTARQQLAEARKSDGAARAAEMAAKREAAKAKRSSGSASGGGGY
jgi:hypothetical protein